MLDILRLCRCLRKLLGALFFSPYKHKKILEAFLLIVPGNGLGELSFAIHPCARGLERPTLEELNEAAAPEVSGCNSPSQAEDFTLLFTRIQTRNTTALCDRNLFSR